MGLIYLNRDSFSSSYIVINNTKIEVEIAEEPGEQQLGLSNRNRLDSNAGMLFVFERLERIGFWMKDTRFNLDIIWIDEDYTIVDIAANLSPGTYPQTFAPNKPAKFALEVNGGYTAVKNIKVGDKVKINY